MQWQAEYINLAQWAARRSGAQPAQAASAAKGAIGAKNALAFAVASSKGKGRAGTAGLHTQCTTFPTPAHRATLVNHGVPHPLPEHPTTFHGNTSRVPHRLVHCPDCHWCTACQCAHATHPSGWAPLEIPVTDNFSKKQGLPSCLAHANAGGAVDLTLQPRLCAACTMDTVQERPCNKEGSGHGGARSNSADTPNSSSERRFSGHVTKLMNKGVRATLSIALTCSTAAFQLPSPNQHTAVSTTRSHRSH